MHKNILEEFRSKTHDIHEVAAFIQHSDVIDAGGGTDIQASSKLQAPNSKSQRITKSQTSEAHESGLMVRRPAGGNRSLQIGCSLVFGNWGLELWW
jgi:hypothetical protein